MVKITLQKHPCLRLKATGHAGAAPHGEDLVCAGISTLLCTLAAQLELAGCRSCARLEPGFAELRAERSRAALAAFSFAETGLQLLAGQYPLYVRIQTQ